MTNFETYERNGRLYTIIDSAEYPVIPLTNNMYAVVSYEDYSRVMERNWYAGPSYAQSNISIKGTVIDTKNGGRKTKQITLLLHRFILGEPVDPSKPLVEHINGNGFDCRRENLQWGNCKTNLNGHRRPKKGSKTGVVGVSMYKNRYRAFITVGNQKNKYLGTFDTLEEAKAVRKKAEEERLQQIKNRD